MQRNTGENEKNRILGCLVKTRNRVKKPFEGETTDIGERVHPPKKEQEDEREKLFQPLNAWSVNHFP